MGEFPDSQGTNQLHTSCCIICNTADANPLTHAQFACQIRMFSLSFGTGHCNDWLPASTYLPWLKQPAHVGIPENSRTVHGAQGGVQLGSVSPTETIPHLPGTPLSLLHDKRWPALLGLRGTTQCRVNLESQLFGLRTGDLERLNECIMDACPFTNAVACIAREL